MDSKQSSLKGRREKPAAVVLGYEDLSPLAVVVGGIIVLLKLHKFSSPSSEARIGRGRVGKRNTVRLNKLGRLLFWLN